MASVSLCAFGEAPFLGEQIESILAQSSPVKKLDVFDDGLDDESLRLVDELLEGRRGGIGYVRNGERRGLVQNFSKAIGENTGDVIFLSDQDDLWMENKVERILERFNAPDAPDLVFSNARLIDESGVALPGDLWGRAAFSPDEYPTPDLFFRRLLKRHVVTGATAAIRASARDYLLPIPDLMPVHLHDGWIALACAAKGRVGWVDEPLIAYRQHAGQNLGAPQRIGLAWMWERIGRYWGAGCRDWKAKLAGEGDAWERTLEALVDRALVNREQETLLQEKVNFLKIRSQPASFVKKLDQCRELWVNGSYHSFHHQPLGAFVTDVVKWK